MMNIPGLRCELTLKALMTTCEKGHVEAVSPVAIFSDRAIFSSAADFCSHRNDDGLSCEARVVASEPVYS